LKKIWPKDDDDSPDAHILEDEKFSEATELILSLRVEFPTLATAVPNANEDVFDMKVRGFPVEVLPEAWRVAREQDLVAQKEDEQKDAGTHSLVVKIFEIVLNNC
jgi:hypothetical protein